MIYEDYIMKMIDQLVRVLSKIFLNKEKGNYQEAFNDIESAFKNILGLDYNLIKNLSAQDIKSLLLINKDDTTINIKYVVIAKLLKERAEINIKGGTNKLNYVGDYQKALNLFLEGILNNKNKGIDLSNFYQDVMEIVKKMDGKISEEDKKNLAKFYKLVNE